MHIGDPSVRLDLGGSETNIHTTITQNAPTVRVLSYTHSEHKQPTHRDCVYEAQIRPLPPIPAEGFCVWDSLGWLDD